MTSARISSKGTMVLLGLLLGLAMAFAASIPAQAADTVPVYRLSNRYNHDFHLWTTKLEEYEYNGSIGWTKEGIAWQTPTTGNPVYRLLNPSDGNHLYTTDLNEYNTLPRYGWVQEQVEFYALDGGAYPVYRLSFSANNDHMLTLSRNEYDVLGTRGWSKEGIAFYVAGPDEPIAPTPGGDTGGSGNQGGGTGGSQGETTFPDPGTVVTGRHKTDFTYWVNRDGKFHLNTCRYVRDDWINSPNWFGTNSREVAASSGRTPCAHCNP